MCDGQSLKRVRTPHSFYTPHDCALGAVSQTRCSSGFLNSSNLQTKKSCLNLRAATWTICWPRQAKRSKRLWTRAQIMSPCCSSSLKSSTSPCPACGARRCADRSRTWPSPLRHLRPPHRLLPLARQRPRSMTRTRRPRTRRRSRPSSKRQRPLNQADLRSKQRWKMATTRPSAKTRRCDLIAPKSFKQGVSFGDAH